MGRGEEAIDEAIVGVGARVIEEGGEFGGGGGKAGEVEGEAADEGWFVGFGGGVEVFFFEAGEDEIIDWVAGPGLVFYGGFFQGGNGRLDGLEVGPVFFAGLRIGPGGSVVDPGF